MIRTHKEKGNTFCASVLFCSSIFSFTLLSIHTLIYLLNSYQQIIRLNKWMNIGSVSFFSTLRFISSHRYKGKASEKTSWVCVRVCVSFVHFLPFVVRAIVSRVFFSSLLFFQITLQSTPHHSIPFLCSYHFILFAFSSMSYAHTLFGSTFG